MFELWFVLRNSPSEFPALHWFYKATVVGLTAEQTAELEGFIE